MLTRLNSERRVIEDENRYLDEFAGYARAGYAGNIRGRQTALRHVNRGNGRAEVFHKAEHYVFDTKKLRAFGGIMRKQGGSAWLSPP
jgi:hypothetical protein